MCTTDTTRHVTGHDATTRRVAAAVPCGSEVSCELCVRASSDDSDSVRSNKSKGGQVGKCVHDHDRPSVSNVKSSRKIKSIKNYTLSIKAIIYNRASCVTQSKCVSADADGRDTRPLHAARPRPPKMVYFLVVAVAGGHSAAGSRRTEGAAAGGRCLPPPELTEPCPLCPCHMPCVVLPTAYR